MWLPSLLLIEASETDNGVKYDVANGEGAAAVARTVAAGSVMMNADELSGLGAAAVDMVDNSDVDAPNSSSNSGNEIGT